MMRWCPLLLGLWIAFPALSVAADGYRILNTYPHDPVAFTQGLIFEDGHLYESTGLYGHSSLREVDLQTGRVLRERDLASQYFGEGLTNWGNALSSSPGRKRLDLYTTARLSDCCARFTIPVRAGVSRRTGAT